MTLEARIRDAEARLLSRFEVAVSERFVEAKDGAAAVRLRVLEYGSGEPVVFLHAASWFAAHWAPLHAHMRASLVCVDMPGHGLSDGVDYAGRDLRKLQVALFAQVFDVLGLSRAPIVGNSLGGLTALWLALDAPEFISRIAILGVPATALPGAQPDLLLSLLSIRHLNRLILALPATAISSRAIMRSAIGPHVASPLPRELFTIHSLCRRRPAFARTIASWMPETHRWRRGHDQITLRDEALAQVRQPVLFYWGECDAFGGSDMARRAAALMPDARVETHPGGHHPQISDPVACAQALSVFLSL